MSKKVIINIGSLVKELNIQTGEFKEGVNKARHMVTEALLKAVEDSQEIIEKKPVYGMDHSKPIAYVMNDAKPCELPSVKREKVQKFIDLMNWAKANHDDYLYNRALETMLDELFKQPAGA